FLTASDINHVLGKVFTALAQDRISIKKAKALAYLAQLMLHSIPTVKDETKFKYTYESWSNMIDNAKKLPKPLPRTSNALTETILGVSKAQTATRDAILRMASTPTPPHPKIEMQRRPSSRHLRRRPVPPPQATSGGHGFSRAKKKAGDSRTSVLRIHPRTRM